MKKLFFMMSLILTMFVSVNAQTTTDEDVGSSQVEQVDLSVDGVTLSINNQIDDLKQLVVNDVSNIINSLFDNEKEHLVDSYRKLSSSFINNTTTTITQTSKQIKEEYYPSINKLLSQSMDNNILNEMTTEDMYDSMNKLLSQTSVSTQ